MTYAHTVSTNLWSACKHSTHFSLSKKIYILSLMTQLNLYSAAVAKVLKFLTTKENQKPVPLLEHDRDEESRPALAAPTWSTACTSAVPVGWPRPSRLGGHAGGTRSPTDA